MAWAKTIKSIFFILVIGWILIGCEKNPESAQQEDERIVGIKSNYLASGKAVDGTDYYTITQNDGRGVDGSSMVIETIPSIYAIDIQMTDLKKTLGINKKNNEAIRQSNLQEFFVNLYDLDSNALIKTIDVKKIMEQEDRVIQSVGTGYYGTRSVNGMPYLEFRIEDYPEKFEEGMASTRRMYLINLETEDTLESEDYNWSTKFPMENKVDIFQEDSFVNKNFSIKGEDGRFAFYVQHMKYWEGCYKVSLRQELMPENNTKLHTMFPKLKQQVEDIRKKEGEYWIQIYLTGNPSQTEIMKLCLPDGQEVIFEEMVVPAESSVDGKEHIVRSLEEYEKHIKLEEGDATGVSPIFESRP